MTDQDPTQITGKTEPCLASEFDRVSLLLADAEKDLENSLIPPHDDEKALKGVITMESAHDPYTRIHTKRVAYYAEKLCLELGYNKNVADYIGRAVEFHDVGKIKIPTAVLHNKGQLTNEQYEAIKKHTTDGAETLLQNSKGYLSVLAAKIALLHHERLDGQGYHNVDGDDLPWYVCLTGICDVFEAMTAPRTYQKNMSPEQALQTMWSQQLKANGKFFDPDMLQAFTKIAPDLFAEAEEKNPVHCRR
jgi:putative two-component system response regulator